jgi:hypothetical protein
MSPIGTDDFWEDLLDFIEQGKVIPVIGEHAVTFGEGNEPLYPWLALELANRLGVTGARLAMTPTLNDVAREHLLAGGDATLSTPGFPASCASGAPRRVAPFAIWLASLLSTFTSPQL